MIYNNFY